MWIPCVYFVCELVPDAVGLICFSTIWQRKTKTKRCMYIAFQDMDEAFNDFRKPELKHWQIDVAQWKGLGGQIKNISLWFNDFVWGHNIEHHRAIINDISASRCKHAIDRLKLNRTKCEKCCTDSEMSTAKKHECLQKKCAPLRLIYSCRSFCVFTVQSALNTILVF